MIELFHVHTVFKLRISFLLLYSISFFFEGEPRYFIMLIETEDQKQFHRILFEAQIVETETQNCVENNSPAHWDS